MLNAFSLCLGRFFPCPPSVFRGFIHPLRFRLDVASTRTEPEGAFKPSSTWWLGHSRIVSFRERGPLVEAQIVMRTAGLHFSGGEEPEMQPDMHASPGAFSSQLMGWQTSEKSQSLPCYPLPSCGSFPHSESTAQLDGFGGRCSGAVAEARRSCGAHLPKLHGVLQRGEPEVLDGRSADPRLRGPPARGGNSHNVGQPQNHSALFGRLGSKFAFQSKKFWKF